MIEDIFIQARLKTHQLASQVNKELLATSGEMSEKNQKVIAKILENWLYQLVVAEEYHKEFARQYSHLRLNNPYILQTIRKEKKYTFDSLAIAVARTLPFITNKRTQLKIRNAMLRILELQKVKIKPIRSCAKAIRSAVKEKTDLLSEMVKELEVLKAHQRELQGANKNSMLLAMVAIQKMHLPIAEKIRPTSKLRQEIIRNECDSETQIRIYKTHLQAIVAQLEQKNYNSVITIEAAEDSIAFLESATSAKNIFYPVHRIRSASKYYQEAPSMKSFGVVKIKNDESYGLFNKEEERIRLRYFEHTTQYPIGCDISKLSNRYFQGDRFIPRYAEYLTELNFLASKAPRLPSTVEAIIIIPAYKEEKNITKTLSKIYSANVPGKIAVVILENMSSKLARDLTVNKVDEFRETHWDLPLYQIFKKFETKVPIGFIRKYANDFAIKLKEQSGISKNFVLVSFDADVEELDLKYFEKIILAFEKNPWLDAVELKLDFPQEYFKKFPNLMILQRLFDYCWKYMRHKINPVRAVRTYGAASAIKASAHLMIGGYNPRATLCEDLQISWLLDCARRGRNGHKYFKYVRAPIIVNPRRAVEAYVSGKSFFDMYGEFDKRQGLFLMDWNQLIKIDLRDIRTVPLEKEIQTFYDWWQTKVGYHLSEAQFVEMFSRAMSFVKLNYVIQNEKIRLLDRPFSLAKPSSKTA